MKHWWDSQRYCRITTSLHRTRGQASIAYRTLQTHSNQAREHGLHHLSPIEVRLLRAWSENVATLCESDEHTVSAMLSGSQSMY